MLNMIQPDTDTLTMVAPAGGVVVGVPVLIGAVCLIPIVTAAAGEKFAGRAEGVFDLPKAAGVALAAGVLVDWNATNKNCVANGTGTHDLGYAVEAAAAGDATVRVAKIAASAVVA